MSVNKKTSLKILVFFVFLLFLTNIKTAKAGFGISPPFVKNNQLFPGSSYEQEILLLRSSAEEELQAEVVVSAPDIDSWITIDKGNKFILPKDQLQVPMKVLVKVPANAEIGNYKGKINIRVLPLDQGQKGGVAIALGARLDVDLTLTNVSFTDFLVRFVSIPDTEILGKPWNWKIWSALYNKFFYKINVVINMENTGNVDIAPTKVQLEVFDITEKKLLETGIDSKMAKVKAFSEGKTVASFPTKLAPGQYWSKVKIYKDDLVVNSYKIAFTIARPGELGGKAQDIGKGPWIFMAGLILSILIILGTLIKIKIWRYIWLLIVWVLFKPLAPVLRKFIQLKNSAKKKFWQWIRQKAESADEKDDSNSNS